MPGIRMVLSIYQSTASGTAELNPAAADIMNWSISLLAGEES